MTGQDPPSAGVREPSLTVIRAPGARRNALQALRLAVVMALFVGGTVSLTVTGRLGLPAQHMVTLNGRLASVSDVFTDPKVIRILRKHNLVVHVTTAGSREVATGSLAGLDFVFPSGESAAQLLFHRPDVTYTRDYQPFTSRLVLATYRDYAQALSRHDSRMATPQGVHPGGQPLYYWLDMDRFLNLTAKRRSWTSIGFAGSKGSGNENVILARTSDVCQSNSADSYLGLIAYIRSPGHSLPTDEGSARKLAHSIGPLMREQGGFGANLSHDYFANGPGDGAPVVVIYEHQYLAHQAAYLARHGEPDSERVLLFPKVQVMSEPQYIALNKKADRLGDLLTNNPELRERLTQLGYRLSDVGGNEDLRGYLEGLGIPAPAPHFDSGEQGQALMPEYKILDTMVTAVGDCQTPAGR